MIDNCILANSIGLYLSLNLREQLHTKRKLFTLLHLDASRPMIMASRPMIDLMSDKYITSLLLIKMLKAFLRVIIKSYCWSLALFLIQHCWSLAVFLIYIYSIAGCLLSLLVACTISYLISD